jgi:hypothetical protein
MHGTFACSDDTAIDLSRIDWEIVIIGDPEPDLVAQYRVISSDRETGTTIGSFVVPAGPGGGPPPITIGDIAESVGRYRIASIYVEIEAERLAGLTRRTSDRERSRARAWLRNVPRSVLAEHGIGPGGR